MTVSLPRDVLDRIRKLASLPEEIRQSRWAISITRLTVLKSLCSEHERANRFVGHLARKTFERMNQQKARSATPTEVSHREMMEQALEGLETWQQTPTDKLRRT